MSYSSPELQSHVVYLDPKMIYKQKVTHKPQVEQPVIQMAQVIHKSKGMHSIFTSHKSFTFHRLFMNHKVIIHRKLFMKYPVPVIQMSQVIHEPKGIHLSQVIHESQVIHTHPNKLFMKHKLLNRVLFMIPHLFHLSLLTPHGCPPLASSY